MSLSAKPRSPRLFSKVFPNEGQRGFTLLEVIIFIVLAGILLPLIIAPFVTSIVNSDIPEVAISASFLATEKLEELQWKSYAWVKTSGGQTRTSISGTPPLSNYEWQRVIREVNGSDLSTTQSGSGYLLLEVTIFHPQLPSAGYKVTSLFTNYLNVVN